MKPRIAKNRDMNVTREKKNMKEREEQHLNYRLNLNEGR